MTDDISKVVRYCMFGQYSIDPDPQGEWVGYDDYATLARQLAEAEREATQLAQWLWRHHWSDVAPKWEPCDSLPGVLSQIDNMIAAMCRTDRAEQAEAQLVEATRRLAEVEGLLLEALPFVNDVAHDAETWMRIDAALKKDTNKHD